MNSGPSNPSNPSEKASGKLSQGHDVDSERLQLGRGGRRFPLSQGFGKCEEEQFLSTKKIEANSKEKADRPGLDMLGKLSHQMLSAASILGNFYFDQWYIGPVRVWCFL